MISRQLNKQYLSSSNQEQSTEKEEECGKQTFFEEIATKSLSVHVCQHLAMMITLKMNA